MAGQHEESSVVKLENHGTGIYALQKAPNELLTLQFSVTRKNEDSQVHKT